MPATDVQALIFEIDGALVDTESAHRNAFNHAFAAHGLHWEWSEAVYTDLLQIKDGRVRILHYWKTCQPEHYASALPDMAYHLGQLHNRKVVAYVIAVNSGAVCLRPGVPELLEEALHAGLRLAIASAALPVNIAALLRQLRGSQWQRDFAVIGDASSAARKKPDPQVYLQVLAELNLAPTQCLAFEDSGNGLLAARAAGLPTLVTPTRYTRHHDFADALRVLPDLSQVDLAQLRCWHENQQYNLRTCEAS